MTLSKSASSIRNIAWYSAPSSTANSRTSVLLILRSSPLIIQPRVQHERLLFRFYLAKIDIDVASSNNFFFLVIMPMFCGHIVYSKWRHSAIFIVTMTHGIARVTHTAFTSRVQGHQKRQPWTRVSNLTPVFTGRVYGSWTRPVNTGSVYRALI